MPHPLPTRRLSDRPDLDVLKRQARRLLDDFRGGDAVAVREVERFFDPTDPTSFALHDAQLVLARSYGYDSWPKLKAFVDGVTVNRLMSAVRAGHLDAVREMLRARPELATAVEAWNREYTALHYAVLDRRPPMVRLLLEFGADPHAGISPHNDATSALTIASERGYDDIVAVLREGAGGRSRSDAGAGAAEPRRDAEAAISLRSAVMRGDTELLRARHAERPLTVAGDDRGWLLRVAVDAERPDMLAFLLDLGLDPDARARVDEGDTIAYTWGMPLYECVRAGKHATAQLLLDRGADPNGQVYASGTPLSEAYGQRDEAMIALLERHGGRSNPSMAGLYRRKDLAERLLAEHGDEPLPDDGFGSGPVAHQLLSAAARGGDPEILAMALARVDWPRGDGRWYAALAGPLGFWNHWVGPWCAHEWDRGTYLACFEMLLERLGPPVARLRFGATILHEVVTMSDHVRPEERAAFARAALDAGAQLDVRDDLLESTPLGWACRWGREELVAVFLERGADPNEADAQPWASPAAWAAKKGHHAISARLEQARRS